MSTTMQPAIVLCDDARPMLLRIAHSIWIEAGLDYTVDDIKKSIRCAKAALGVLRDLNPPMIEAGARAVCLAEGDNPDAMHGGIRSWTLCACQAVPAFTAMIDAIIAEARS